MYERGLGEVQLGSYVLADLLGQPVLGDAYAGRVPLEPVRREGIDYEELDGAVPLVLQVPTFPCENKWVALIRVFGALVDNQKPLDAGPPKFKSLLIVRVCPGWNMTLTRTDYGYKIEKDINAGVTELRVLLSNPKNLATTYYQTLEKDDQHLSFTDSMHSSMYGVELLEANPGGPVVYRFTMDMPSMIRKTSRMEIFIEPKDDIKTRMLIKSSRMDIQFAEQMEASLHYLPKDTLDGMTSTMMELTVFQGMIDQAIAANLPYIRDAIIVKGDYIGTKVEIKDSVLQRTNINVDGKPPSDVHIRTDGNYVPTKTTIENSVITKSDIGKEGPVEVKDSVIVGKGGGEGVGGAAKCLGNSNLEAYRRALERAMLDGVIVESEERLLRSLRSSLGVTVEQHEQLLEDIKLSTDKNYQTYKQVVFESMVDGRIDDDEMGMLESLRQSLGISDAIHAKVFEDVKKQKGC